MPPPEAVKAGKVQPLSDEDRRTLVRWIDLGCPIDLAYDPKEPAKPGPGWLLDDQRPTVALASPKAGANGPLDRILVETDAPFLAPVPHRGKRNEPALVRRVAEEVATATRRPLVEIAAATVRNTERVFRLPA